MIGIYKIECVIDHSIYIGQSIDVKHRIAQHKSNLRANRHRNQHLQNAVNKYGLENFTFEILTTLSEEDYTKEKLDDLEINTIAMFHSNERGVGYNIENGGNSIGRVSEETKHKMSMVRLGKKFKPHSEETKALMRKNNAHYWQGKHHSEETKEKIRQKNLGRTPVLPGTKLPNEWKENISKSQIGCKWVHKGNESHFIKPEDVEEYINNGYELGRPFFKRKR